MRILPKEITTFWTLFTAPVMWAFHFLACYLIAAIWCAKRGDVGFNLVQLAIAGVTLLALGMILISTWLAWRQWGGGTHAPPTR